MSFFFFFARSPRTSLEFVTKFLLLEGWKKESLQGGRATKGKRLVRLGTQEIELAYLSRAWDMSGWTEEERTFVAETKANAKTKQSLRRSGRIKQSDIIKFRVLARSRKGNFKERGDMVILDDLSSRSKEMLGIMECP